jgi:hypoxanthine phosphoribosyltransferase
LLKQIDIDKPLITAKSIAKRVGELANEVDADYRDTGRALSVIVVLKGGCFFAVDLLKHLTLPVRLDFVQASSYHGGTQSKGEVHLHKDISMPIGGTDVLLIEDIVDTGLTAAWLLQHLRSHDPESLRLCALLDKPSGRLAEVPIDYTGFVIPDAFVLGYGLDYDEGYRNLPAIYAAKA